MAMDISGTRLGLYTGYSFLQNMDLQPFGEGRPTPAGSTPTPIPVRGPGHKIYNNKSPPQWQ